MSSAPIPDRVLFFDGVCVFCNGAVDRLLRIDRDELFTFASLQGDTAAAVRARHDAMPEAIETVVLLEDDTLYLRSRAVFQAARHLPYPWRMLSWLRFLPRWLTDPPYNLFASMRYRLFGQREACRVPTPEHRARFLP